MGAGGDGVGGEDVLAVGGVADEDLRVDFVAVFEDDDVFHAGGFVDFLADGDADDEVAEVDLASPTPSSHRVLANLVAHRQNGCFPMIGKYFSNGWKILADFSNDWKKFSRVFQRLEKIFGERVGSQGLWTGRMVWPE